MTAVEQVFNKVEAFFVKHRVLRVRQGEVVLRANEAPAGVYYLKRGFCRVYGISRQGEELTLIIFKPGDFFPMTWALANEQNSYFVEAMTFCELGLAPRGEFVQFLQNDPQVLWEVTARMLVRFGGLMTRMEYLVFGHAYAKVASIIMICARRFGRLEGENTVIEVPLRHIDIANLVGITRETASIEIKKLERRGTIFWRGKLLVVKNPRDLRRQSLLG